MTRLAPQDWPAFNHAVLSAELDDLRRRLEDHAGQEATTEHRPQPRRTQAANGPPSALDGLCDRFGLSPFERHVLLLAAGVELDHRIHALAAAAGGATFALALAVLPDGHWSAAEAMAALRHWHMIELGPAATLMHSPLRIDGYILGFLLGQDSVDPRLLALSDGISPAPLAPSQSALAERLALIWQQAEGVPPILQLNESEDGAPTAGIAAAACAILTMGLTPLAAAALPAASVELDLIARLCERHARLTDGAILLACDDDADPTREAAIGHWIERLGAPLFLTGRKRRRTRWRPILNFEVAKPTETEQRALWREMLGHAPGAALAARRLAAQFHLSAGAIAGIAADARAEASSFPEDAHSLADALWQSARRQVRPRLDDLARRVETTAGWSDLILPEPQMQILRAIQAQLGHRPTVHEDWGFGAKGARGLGLAVLFAGSSGTGKTTAAEILARELRLDLYRIDLSAVVSKYIGETEKNLRRVFDAAEEGGAILLFDEADALFGKRTEVSDSHDRHANVEVSYLLQRIEAFRGLAILTSNMKNALDVAFLRRLRFIVSFPFPDATLRAEIWRRAFPAATPTAGLDMRLLAQLGLSGGQIRNIALNAAFLAAAAGTPVGMAEIRAAARAEYAKQDKILTEGELKGWPA